MKNKTTIHLPLILFLLIMVTACSAKLKPEPAYEELPTATGITTAGAVNPNEVNEKVLKNFQRVYGHVTGAKWLKSANGFMVVFRNNNMSNTVYYRGNGAVEATVHAYSADQLVPSVRAIVESAFLHHTLLHVTQVEKNGVTAYYVKVQDATSVKTVKVIGEEWELTETLVKR